MGRPLRIEYDGAWYHVMNRGLERRRIFVSDKDYHNFLSLLKEISEIHFLEIHAFSLMPNHYHLLCHTPKAGLKRAMQHLNGVYTRKFNCSHRRDGPLFRGRYKAILVDSNEYLTELVRYIHLNPVKAHICKDPKDHQWTSHRNYLKYIKGYEWLCVEQVLSEYGRDIKQARKKFDVIVRSTMSSDEVIKEIEMPKNGITGSDFFKKWVNSNYVEQSIQKDRAVSKKEQQIRSETTAKALLEKICFCYDMTFGEIKKTKTSQKNEARSLAIYFMRQKLGYSLKDITKWLKAANEYAVAKSLSRFKKEMSTDKKVHKKVREIERVVFG